MLQSEFVKQVYYLQEKVLLDFHPTDDKYQEVIYEANLVLQELQKEEDWLWLREQIILGDMDCAPGDIPEFGLPEWVYKVSTLHKDCIHLHPHDHRSETGYNQWTAIEVPYVSVGRASSKTHKTFIGPFNNVVDPALGAIVVGNTITFTRPLTPVERNCVAVTDVQRRIELMRTLDSIPPVITNGEEDTDATRQLRNHELAADEVLVEIPDPNYVITRTAALHAQGSPPAQSRALDLSDQAQKLLSAMRAHDAEATDADFVEWSVPGYIEMI